MRWRFRARPGNHRDLRRKNIVQPRPPVGTERPNKINGRLRLGNTVALTFTEGQELLDLLIELRSIHDVRLAANAAAQRPPDLVHWLSAPMAPAVMPNKAQRMPKTFPASPALM